MNENDVNGLKGDILVYIHIKLHMVYMYKKLTLCCVGL